MSQVSVELGWMNIQPCAKVEWVPSSIPGVHTPVLKTAEQRLVAYGVFDGQAIQNQGLQLIKECALAAVAAAGGIGAITANPAAAVAAFKTTFLACLANKGPGIVVNNIAIETRAQCMW